MKVTAKRDALRTHRLHLGLLSLVALLLGLAPAAMVMGNAWLVPYIAAGSALVAIIVATVTARVPSPVRPSYRELAIGAVNGALLPSILGAAWLAIYGVSLLVTNVLNQWLKLDADASHIGSVIGTAVMVIIAIPLCIFLVDDLGAALYPTDGETTTRFEEFVGNQTVLTAALSIIATTVALIVVAILLFGPQTSIAWLITLVSIGTLALYFEPTPEAPPEFDRADEHTLELIRSALSNTIPPPLAQFRTGNPRIDPLLSLVDFVTVDGQVQYVVEVKHARPGAPILEWMTGTTVLNASRALATDPHNKGIEFRPVLVIVDGKPGGSLEEFCVSQGISMLTLNRQTGQSDAIGPHAEFLRHGASRFFEMAVRVSEADARRAHVVRRGGTHRAPRVSTGRRQAHNSGGEK